MYDLCYRCAALAGWSLVVVPAAWTLRRVSAGRGLRVQYEYRIGEKMPQHDFTVDRLPYYSTITYTVCSCSLSVLGLLIMMANDKWE